MFVNISDQTYTENCINSLKPGDAYINGLVQDYSNSIANALELLQSCTEPLIYASANWNINDSGDGLVPVRHHGACKVRH